MVSRETGNCGRTTDRLVVFLIYINDLRQGLTNDVKLFAEDTSLFPANQVQEVVFSKKRILSINPPLFLNNSKIKQTKTQKHVGLNLDLRTT